MNTDVNIIEDPKTIKIEKEVNRCGCTTIFTKIFTGSCCLLFIIFWLIAVFIAFGILRNILFILGWISVIITVIGLSLIFCACCRPAKGSDE